MKMKEIKNRNEGVTLIALTMTIALLLIIAGITIYSGKDTIKKAKLEELKTNMLLIQAKAREYVEDATFKMGINPDDNKRNQVREEVYIQNAKLTKADTVPSEFGIIDTSTCYWLTEEAQNNWGLEKMDLDTNEKYLIQFKESEETVEVYNSLGYNGKYSLTEIDKLQK